MPRKTESNLYASRCWAEHPIGLWPIDEELTYVSLMTPQQRDMRTWNTSSTISKYQDYQIDGVPDPPFVDDQTYMIAGPSGYAQRGGMTMAYIEVVSQPLFQLQDLNPDLRVFSLNTYVYSDKPVAFYEIGYLYNDQTETRFIEHLDPGPLRHWVRLGRTFDHNFEALDARIFIRAYFNAADDISLLVNGTSLGQWSETFSSHSLGLHPAPIPEHTGLPRLLGPVSGVPLREYGPGDDVAYALESDGRLLATNGGIPLVYGSSTVTTLVPSDLPAIVVPGKGLLHDSGRNNVYTFEAWVRLRNTSPDSHRIIGPVASKDGIYVRGNSIALVIGNDFRSYCVGDWYRPMLLHMIIKEQFAELYINGDRVIEMPIGRLSLPDSRLSNTDWIGFYASDSVDTFTMDSVSIYPYAVPAAVTKRRYVWGQGVDNPETVNAAYYGTPYAIDFAYANYDVNHSYPETARFDVGKIDNLVGTRYALKPNTFTLPSFQTANRSLDEVMAYSSSVGTLSFAAPNPEPSYVFFDTMDVLPGRERFVYGVFEGSAEHEQPLMTFVHRSTLDTLSIVIADQRVEYRLNGTAYQTAWVDPDAPFFVGIDIASSPESVREFFVDIRAVQLFVAGTMESVYTGLVHKVAFGTRTNMSGVVFHDGGTISQSSDHGHVASYGLIFINAYGRMVPDIETAGSWSESFPLDYLCVNKKLDFLQFNIDSPSYLTRATLSVTSKDKDTVSPVSSNHLRPGDSRELTNGSVVFIDGDPSKTLATIRLDVKIRGVLTTNWAIRDMSLTSIANTTTLFDTIGTTHGHDMAPYTQHGNYYSADVSRPWTIYKGSTPYLYLTDDSGVRPLANEGTAEAGIWLSINKDKSSDFKISAMQLWVKLADDIDAETEIFAVRTRSKIIKFIAVPDGSGRARVYATSGGVDYTDINFHQDGYPCVMPFIRKDNWTSIGIDFQPLLDFESDQGAICLISSCVFNNIVYYKTSQLQEQYAFIFRTWRDVLTDGLDTHDWEYWRDTYAGVGATWDQVSKSETLSYGVSVDEIYKTYVGTNRTIVDDNDSMLLLDGGTTTVISGTINENSDQHHTRIVVGNRPSWQTMTISEP